MQKQKISRWAEALHFPLWIAKDAAWFFGLGWLSLVLAIPVIFLGTWIAIMSRGVARWEWTLISLWLLANTLWMSSELFSHGLKIAATTGWSLALGVLPFYVLFMMKHLKK
jgi:hypothetical protein